MSVSISVVICAHTTDRWNATLAAVESVRKQAFPATETILVVDHNAQLQADLAAALPGILVTGNRQQRGLSGGRNTGIGLARGDIVAFLDDDAIADPQWLAFLAESYADPAVAGVGGLTLPRWQGRPGRMLSWRQVAEAASAGVEIGAHSHTHPQLDQLRAPELARELRISRELLEDRLARPVTGTAYPFGYSNGRVRQAARAAGYQYACAVANSLPGPAPDLFALPRLTVRRSTGPGMFGQLIRGEQIPLVFARDRALTKGWAVVRRVRSAAVLAHAPAR